LVLAGSDSPGATVGRDLTSDLTPTTCVVAPGDAGLYTVQASTDHTPQADGQGSILFEAQVDSQGSATNVYADFVLGTEEYTESDCTISASGWSAQGSSPSPPSVAPGRVFGHLTCPNAQGVLGALVVCVIEADFVYENCAQQ
ncbi:MAG: hypothetical protein FWD17_09475, partial [Polyangiaceae bacterium]|nr:hypothetical protein [Polyangiaceae bacterium]